MKNKPLVSIVTPSFNSKRFFKDAYDSVINQTYQNWEWIIIDDCSNDGSFEYVLSLVGDNPKIKLLKNTSNEGAAISRNRGIEMASGDYIAFLDSDDMWKSEKLEKQIDFMEKNDFAFTYSCYEVLTEKGKTKVFKPKKCFSTYKYLLRKCDIGCLTVVFSQKKIGKVLMPLDTPKREDYAAWLTITKKGITPIKFDMVLAIYRLSSTAVTSNKFKMLPYHWNVYRKHEKFGVIKSIYYLFIFSFNKIFFKY